MSLELALTLPILMIVLLALFEFSMLFFARGDVVEASRIGARTASLPGSTWDDVENSVYSVHRSFRSRATGGDSPSGVVRGRLGSKR